MRMIPSFPSRISLGILSLYPAQTQHRLAKPRPTFLRFAIVYHNDSAGGHARIDPGKALYSGFIEINVEQAKSNWSNRREVEFCYVALHGLHTAQAVDVHRLVEPRLFILLKITGYAPGFAALLHLEVRMFRA